MVVIVLRRYDTSKSKTFFRLNQSINDKTMPRVVAIHL